MTSTRIVRQTMRECLSQPLFLFLMIVEFVVVLLLVFGLGFHYEQGILVSLDLLGGTVRDDAKLIIDSLAETAFTLISNIFMFLLLLMSSAVYSELLRNPLLSIVLTKPVSRVTLFFSTFAGFVISVFANTLLFSVVLAVTIALKTEGSPPLSLVMGAISFNVEFWALFGLCAFLAMAVDHPFGIAVVMAALYYFVGPLLAGADETASVFAKLAALFVPPIGMVTKTTKHIVLHGAGNLNALLAILPYIALCIGGGAYLFRRKDLK